MPPNIQSLILLRRSLLIQSTPLTPLGALESSSLWRQASKKTFRSTRIHRKLLSHKSPTLSRSLVGITLQESKSKKIILSQLPIEPKIMTAIMLITIRLLITTRRLRILVLIKTSQLFNQSNSHRQSTTFTLVHRHLTQDFLPSRLLPHLQLAILFAVLSIRIPASRGMLHAMHLTLLTVQ